MYQTSIAQMFLSMIIYILFIVLSFLQFNMQSSSKIFENLDKNMALSEYKER
jgi:flagellar biogenesis protein FliO